MHELYNQWKRAAQSLDSLEGRPRWGTVTSTRNTDTGYEVKLKIQPEDVQSGWFPVLSPMVGGGWGLVCPPVPGQQALFIPDLGHGEHGVVVGLGYSTANMPPQPGGKPVTPGQFALMHKNGSYLHFNDDDVLLVTNRDLTATVGRNMTANVTQHATVAAQGTIDLISPTEINFSSPVIGGDADGKGGSATWTFKGDLRVSGEVTAGFGGGSVGLLTHKHTQGPDGHGDSERPTDSPIAGT